MKYADCVSDLSSGNNVCRSRVNMVKEFDGAAARALDTYAYRLADMTRDSMTIIPWQCHVEPATAIYMIIAIPVAAMLCKLHSKAMFDNMFNSSSLTCNMHGRSCDHDQYRVAVLCCRWFSRRRVVHGLARSGSFN